MTMKGNKTTNKKSNITMLNSLFSPEMYFKRIIISDLNPLATG